MNFQFTFGENSGHIQTTFRQYSDNIGSLTTLAQAGKSGCTAAEAKVMSAPELKAKFDESLMKV